MLLVRPLLLADEGPHGYLLRLAQANALTYGELLKLNIVLPHEYPHELPSLVGKGLDTEQWQVQFAWPARWNQKVPRACPHCLTEAPYWRAWWELEFYDVCHIHQVNLTDKCDQCGVVFSWHRDSVAHCICKASIAAQSTQPSLPSMVRLSEIIAAKWMQRDCPNTPSHLFAMNVLEFQQVIHLFGAYAAFSGNNRPQKIANIKQLEVSWRITSVVAELIEQWPKAFHQLLDNLQKDRRGSTARMPARFGHFYNTLYRQLVGPAFDGLRGEFQNYLKQHWDAPLAKRNRRLTPDVSAQLSWVHASSAQTTLGVSRQRVNQLIVDKRIQAREHHTESGRSFLMVRRADVEREAPLIKNEVNLRTAQRMLGLNRGRLENICTLLFPDAVKISDGSPWAIPLESINRILNFGKSVETKNVVAHHEIAMRDVLQYWQWSDQQVIDLINAVISQTLTLNGTHQGWAGIAGWVFDREMLGPWTDGNKLSRIHLTVPEVAERLGVKQEVAYFWVRAGILPTVKSEETHASISIPAFDAFIETHVLAARLARRCNTSPRALVEQLNQKNIAPISGPKIDGCRQILFRREPQLYNAIKMIYPDARIQS